MTAATTSAAPPRTPSVRREGVWPDSESSPRGQRARGAGRRAARGRGRRLGVRDGRPTRPAWWARCGGGGRRRRGAADGRARAGRGPREAVLVTAFVPAGVAGAGVAGALPSSGFVASAVPAAAAAPPRCRARRRRASGHRRDRLGTVVAGASPRRRVVGGAPAMPGVGGARALRGARASRRRSAAGRPPLRRSADGRLARCVGRHARLELGGALGRAAGPFAQALDLARLREVQQRQDAEPEDRRDAGVGAVLLDLLLRREGGDAPS